MTKEEYEIYKKQKLKEDAERELLSGKLGAKDSLWSPQEELQIYTLEGKKPRKMVLKKKGTKFSDNYVPSLMPIEGVIVYYISRDEKGNPIGEPKKYLQIISKGIWKEEFVDADKIEPYYVDVIKKKGKGYGAAELDKAKKVFGIKDIENVKTEDLLVSKFTGLDDITKAMDKYGADGLDLSNADGLDESILQKYSNLTDQSLLDGLTENTSLLEFEGKYSNLTDQSLLDGLTENTSLLEFEGDYSNLTDQSLLDGLTENTSLLEFEGNEDYSNGIGSWFKKTFKRKKKKKALEEIADPTTDLVPAATMQQAYKESGSKKSFKDWVSSDGGKNFLNAVTQFATVFLTKQEKDTKDTKDTKGEKDTTTSGKGESDSQEKEEYTILGMSPIVFGLVAVSAIVVTSVVAIKLMKNKQPIK